MGKVVILGTAYSIPDEMHENTHLMVIEGDRNVLIDCASNPVVHLAKAGLNVEKITDIILTHFHPDHVSGIPLLLMDLWLLGRKQRLLIHGLKSTIEKTKAVMDIYEWDKWPEFYPVEFLVIPGNEANQVLDYPGLRITSTPVVHLIPTLGLRIDFIKNNKVIVYSCDTEPCQQVERLARDCDILIHEASGSSIGHSSASQAGRVARNAKAKSLILIHYPTHGIKKSGEIIEEALMEFNGPVDVAKDFMEILC